MMRKSSFSISSAIRPRRGVVDHEIGGEELRRVGPSADGERKSISWMRSRVLPLAALAHGLNHPAQAGDEAVVADAQQRAGRHVADAGRLDDEHPRAAVREARIPVDVRGR